MFLFLLIVLHTVDGHTVQVSPEQITSMHGPRGKSMFTEGAHCLVNLTDGKFVTVTETCEDIQRIVEGK